MHINIRWDNDERSVLLWEFDPAWTLVEFDRAGADSHALIASTPGTVDMIFDVSRSPGLPGDVVSHARACEEQRPANRGLLVVAGASRLMQSAIRAFNLVYGSYLHVEILTAPTLADARALIRQRRGRL